MATYYKYAEREADSQVNWAEVGKNMSDMLAETNRVREEKKAAIDQATREAMNELATSPNGEHKGARTAALEFADQASNYVRIQENLLKRGQISLKEYTINRQNINDGTELAFNALKAYQANYGNTMQRYRDGKASLYETRQRQKAEGFGDFNKAALYINPTNGKVMSAMKTEKVIDGKTVYTMDDTPGKMASVDQINTMIVGEWDKYDYATPIKGFVDALGEEKTTAVILGGITKQGKITSIEDITSRTDIIEDDKQKLYKFINSENGMIETIIGPPINKLRVLLDSIPVAPNGKPYDVTDDPEEAKKNPNLILEIINPSTGQSDPVFTDEQTQDAEEFIRNQMRSQYDYKEEGQAVGAVSRDEESEDSKKRKDDLKEKDNALGTWGDVFKAGTPADKIAAINTILGSKLSQSRGLLDIDTSVPGKLTFKYKDPDLNRTLDYDPNAITLGQWNELGNEVHGVDNVAETMKLNKGGDPNMKMGASQKNFEGVKAGRTAVKDPEIEFSNKVKTGMSSIIKERGGNRPLKDKEAAAEISKLIEGTGITIVPNKGVNVFNDVNLKIGEEEYEYPVNYDTRLNEKDGTPVDKEEYDKAQTATRNLIEWIEQNTPAANKKTILTKTGNAAQY
jgi:hypothetical protein